jgi:hypothetical protein
VSNGGDTDCLFHLRMVVGRLAPFVLKEIAMIEKL